MCEKLLNCSEYQAFLYYRPQTDKATFYILLSEKYSCPENRQYVKNKVMSTPEEAHVNVSSDLLDIKPPSFDCWHDDNLPQKLKSFRGYCELVFSIPAYSSKPNSELVKYILLWMGPQAIELFDNWTLTEEQRHNPQDVWSAFQNYFEPKSTVHKPHGTICFLNAPLAEFTHQCLKNSHKSIFRHDIFCSIKTI